MTTTLEIEAVRVTPARTSYTLQIRTRSYVRVFVGPRAELVVEAQRLAVANGLVPIGPDHWTTPGHAAAILGD